MILEGVLTTQNVDGSTHIAAMGTVLDERWDSVVLRPYQTSQTFENLKRLGEAVFHITDDVELLVRSALGLIPEPPPLQPACCIRGRIIQDTCRWYELRVTTVDDRQPRSQIACHLVHQGWLRDFVGFCRAKHAVLEGAILASRRDLLPAGEIRREFARLSVIVEKTAGDQERRAFATLSRYIEEAK
jgi:hypothetical protein